ncbi:MAG: septum formation family protein, partial [Propionibacteriaceae bacterium]|nr:septum formation family protein [Propionibacteriaceae bacterium]
APETEAEPEPEPEPASDAPLLTIVPASPAPTDTVPPAADTVLTITAPAPKPAASAPAAEAPAGRRKFSVRRLRRPVGPWTAKPPVPPESGESDSDAVPGASGATPVASPYPYPASVTGAPAADQALARAGLRPFSVKSLRLPATPDTARVRRPSVPVHPSVPVIPQPSSPRPGRPPLGPAARRPDNRPLKPLLPGEAETDQATPSSPTRRHWGGRVLAVLALVGAAVGVMYLLGWFGNSTAAVDPRDLAVGDCVLADPTTGGSSQVDCTADHHWEVVFLTEVSGTALPDNNKLSKWAEETCMAPFADYVGQSYPDSDLALSWLAPTAEQWRDGSRTVACVVGTGTTTPQQGSLRQGTN